MKTQLNEVKRMQQLAGILNEEVSPEINDLIQKGLQMQKDIELQNQNKNANFVLVLVDFVSILVNFGIPKL